jgi:hypothetical protein
VGLKRLKSRAHGGLPGGPAEGRRQGFEALNSVPKEVAIVGMDHRLHKADHRVSCEQGQRPPQHGIATDRPELLRPISSGAYTPAGGHHYHCHVNH